MILWAKRNYIENEVVMAQSKSGSEGLIQVFCSASWSSRQTNP